jgi:hypothetical protein
VPRRGYGRSMSTLRALVCGAVAGAAGTTALNAVTFLDMAVRGRPASSTPEETVRRGAGLVGAPIPGDDEHRAARTTGLGALAGSVAGVGAGVVLGALRGPVLPSGSASTFAGAWVLAMLVGNGPMTVLGVTDPRRWSAGDWTADVVPHLAYAAAATVALELTDPR